MIKIVYGPKMCGKTRNKDIIAAHFGCDKIYDCDAHDSRSLRDYLVEVVKFQESNPGKDILVLTNVDKGVFVSAIIRLRSSIAGEFQTIKHIVNEIGHVSFYDVRTQVKQVSKSIGESLWSD